MLRALLLIAALALTPTDAPALLAEAEAAVAAASAGLRVTADVTAGSETLTVQVDLQERAARLTVQAPAARQGEVLLLVGERLWYTRPGLLRPAPISAQQALQGAATNRDVVFLLTRAKDAYDAALSGTETVDGTPTRVLQLTARTAEAPYPRVRVWIADDPRRVLRLVFQDSKGQDLRQADLRWGGSVVIDGKTWPFPTGATVRDLRRAGAPTVVTWRDPVAMGFPADHFKPEALRSPP